MTVYLKNVIKKYICLAADTKPTLTTADAGSKCYESDTGKWYVWNGASWVQHSPTIYYVDDQFIDFGGVAKLGWETKDANANALIFALPEGGSVDVPVLVIGDASILDTDLGFFNGITEPRIAVLDDDKDSAVSLGFNANNDARILLSGSATLTMPAFTAGGDISLGANKLKTTNLVFKEYDADSFGLLNLAEDGTRQLILSNLVLYGCILTSLDGAWLQAKDADACYFMFKARDTGVSLVEVARLVGAADPYFQMTLAMRLNPIATASLPATPVEGMLVYDDTANKLKVYNGSAWETVTSA